jgi:hypothetical protein
VRAAVNTWLCASAVAASVLAVHGFKLAYMHVHYSWIEEVVDLRGGSGLRNRCSKPRNARAQMDPSRGVVPPEPPRRIAILFRGQPFRRKAYTSCSLSVATIERSLRTTASTYARHLIEPLAARGHTVDILYFVPRTNRARTEAVAAIVSPWRGVA